MPNRVGRIFFDRWGHLYVGWGICLGLLALAAVFVTAWALVIATDRPQCGQRGQGLHTESRYLLPWGGCQFRLPDGRWIDSDAYRVVVRGGA